MAHLDPLAAGTKVGNYQIIEAVDINSHSVVYCARVNDSTEEVLLQEFAPGDLVSRQSGDRTVRPLQGKEKIFEDSLSLFLQEARILSQIRDPYIARVREYTEARGTAFIVMELEQGQSLDDHLKRVGRLDERALRQLFVSLLKGLRVIHEHHLLHRDINPKNIFLRDTGPPVILGFGSTQRALAGTEIKSENRVTPGFSPLEQYHEEGNLGPWTDLYALGAVLYKAMRGSTPVEAPERVAAVAEGKPDPLISAAESGGDDYQASLLQGIDWLLNPFIDQRPKSVSEILGPTAETQRPPASVGKKPGAVSQTPALSSTEKIAPVPQRDLDLGSPRLYADPSSRIGTEPISSRRASNYLAGLIVAVFIIAVGTFTFWPQIKSITDGEEQAAKTPTTIEGTKIPDNILEQPLPDESQPPEPPESLTFTREEDKLRAEQYRKIEEYDNRIRRLLESARAKFLVGKLILPERNNALVDYRAILKIDEDNVDALQGIEEIASSMFNRAQTELQQGELEASLKTLNAMQQNGLDSAGVDALRMEIDKLWERKEVEEERAKLLAEQQRIEQERAAEEGHAKQAEPAAEQARLGPEKRAEQERIEREAQAAEQARVEQEIRAETERLKQEVQAAEEPRQEQQEQAEQTRVEQEIRAETERLKQEALAAEEQRREQEKQAQQARVEQEILAQQAELEQARSARIEELLASATTALAGGLTDASAETALTHYRQVLSIDPTHAAAQAGITEIVEHYIEIANRALALDQFEQVENRLLLISAIDPAHPAVNLLRNQLKIRREAFAQSQLKQERERELERAAQEKAQQEMLKQKEKELEQRTLAQGINAYYRGEYSTALDLLLPLAEQGNNRAQFRVGVMYLRGRGAERNTDTGTAWIRRAFPAVQSAATSGEAWAQADMGSLYETGLLVAQNNEEAVRWYKLAADQGYAGAQTNLGTMYATGSGVAKSRDEAIKWLKRAAAQGDKVAQKNLNALGIQ